MTCRDIYGCKNCPIKNECDEADDFCEKIFYSGGFDHELLMKIYTKGREDERKDWECAAGELIIKYAGDIYEALPEAVNEIYRKGREDALNEVLNLVKAPHNDAYCSLIRTGDIDICDEYIDCAECIVKYLVGKDINVPNKKEGEQNG